MNLCATITVACCILHNYCILQGERLPRPTNDRVGMDAFARRHRSPQYAINEGIDAKLAEERMKSALFAS